MPQIVFTIGKYILLTYIVGHGLNDSYRGVRWLMAKFSKGDEATDTKSDTQQEPVTASA